MDRIQRACGTLNRHSHTEAHPKILCEETRPASHLQKLLCSLQIMTKVLLIPQLVQAPPFCLLGPLPGQDPLGVPAQVRGLPQGHLLSLFAGVGSQGSCVEGGLRDLGAGSPEHGGRGWASGGTQGLRSWHGHGLGPPYGLYPPSREPTPAPFSISGSLQVVVYQPKVIGVVFWIFSFVFRFFFKQSIFLGAITQKGPVGCVRVS